VTRIVETLLMFALVLAVGAVLLPAAGVAVSTAACTALTVAARQCTSRGRPIRWKAVPA
jgi:hypothetical protein